MALLPTPAFENPRGLILGVCKRNSTVPEIQFILEDLEGVLITELTGGYGNYTFRVQSRDLTKSVIIKHGLSHFKVFTQFKAPLKRRLIEYETMKMLDSLKPGSSPKPYCLDMEDNVIIMEDLSHMMILSSFTDCHKTDETCMRCWAETISLLHWSTHKKNMSEQAWQDMYQIFGGSEIKSPIMDFHLVKPLDPEDETINLEGEIIKEAYDELIDDAWIVAKYAELRKMVETEQCLIHADNHQASVFFDDSRCALFDAEVSGLSLPEYHVALMAPWFILGVLALPPSEEKESIRKKFISATKVFLDTYIEGIPDMKDEGYKQEFISLTSSFCAAMCFRLIIMPGVRDIWPGTPAEVARIMRHMTSIFRHASAINSVDAYLDTFFSDPTPQ